MKDKHEKYNSINFRDSEIKGIIEINGVKVIYLKPRVTRKKFYDWPDDSAISHINEELIRFEKSEWFKKLIMGEEDFTND